MGEFHPQRSNSDKFKWLCFSDNKEGDMKKKQIEQTETLKNLKYFDKQEEKRKRKRN